MSNPNDSTFAAFASGLQEAIHPNRPRVSTNPITGLFDFIFAATMRRKLDVPSKYARRNSQPRLRRGRKNNKPKPFIGKVKNIVGTRTGHPRHSSSAIRTQARYDLVQANRREAERVALHDRMVALDAA